MRLMTFALALALLAGRMQAAPDLVAQAKASTTDAVNSLIALEQQIADDAFHTGDWERTIAAQDHIIALGPSDIEPYAVAAWLLWSADRHDEAMRYYRRMIVARPHDPEGYFTIGFYFATRMRDPQEALSWMEKALAAGLQPPKSHLYGHLLAQLGRADEAQAFWRALLAAHPDDPIARRELDKLAPSRE